MEVITPVLDPDIKADVINTIDFALLDNTQARVIDGEGSLKIRTTSAGEPFRSQERLYQHYTEINSQQDKN